MFDPRRPDRVAFLRIAILFEGGLVGVAYLLGWLAGIDPFADFHWSGDAVSYGMLGTAPLALLFFWSYQQPHPELQKIRRVLMDTLAPQLALCRVHELFLVAAVAGIGEEALFRGMLQPWAEGHWGGYGGLVVSNLLFGMVHLLTPLYGLLAFATGVYLGLMLDVGGQRNLLTPMVVHALYDFVAFVAVAQSFRQEQSGRA